MTLSPDRERVRQILSETIGLLCRNGLSFDFELSVDALIGITVDHKDVFLISIKDTFDSEKNLQQPHGGSSVTAAQILSDCDQKNSSASLDSAARCKLPSSMHSDWSHADKNSSFEKLGTSNSFISTQSNCKRMIERSDHLDDQTKRARILVNANVEASRDKPTLLAVVKTEPCDSLFTTNTSGTMSCEKSPNSNTSRDMCTSGSVSLVNSQLNSVIDTVRLKVRAPSFKEDSAGKVPDVFCVTKECDLPSICVLQNNSTGSQLSADCDDGVSSFDRQDMSQTDSNSDKQCSVIPSRVHAQDFSVASRYNLQVTPSISHSGQSTRQMPANSECSSDSLTLESTSDQAKSQRSIHQRKSNEAVYEANVEYASSDSEVICIKEEIPFNSNASFLIDPHPSLQTTRLKEVAITQRAVNSLNLDSLSNDHSVGWRSIQNNFCHLVRRQQKDTWCQDNVVPSSYMDTQCVEKQLKQCAQSILLYDGQYVPLRDIQRLRLCGMAAGQIKLAMEQLSSYDGKLGCFQVLHGGVNLFYKCPPNLVEREVLESSFCIPWETYKFHYDVTPASNITTRHNDQYWLKVASSSPYNVLNRDLIIA